MFNILDMEQIVTSIIQTAMSFIPIEVKESFRKNENGVRTSIGIVQSYHVHIDKQVEDEGSFYIKRKSAFVHVLFVHPSHIYTAVIFDDSLKNVHPLDIFNWNGIPKECIINKSNHDSEWTGGVGFAVNEAYFGVHKRLFSDVPEKDIPAPINCNIQASMTSYNREKLFTFVEVQFKELEESKQDIYRQTSIVSIKPLSMETVIKKD